MRKRNKVILAVIGVVVVCCVSTVLASVLLGPLIESPEVVAVEPGVVTEVTSVAPLPTRTSQPLPSPTLTPNVVIVLDPEERVRAVLVGEGNVTVRVQEVEGYGEGIFVAFHVRDNFTNGMVRDGAFKDIGHMAELIWATGLHDYAYCFGGIFPIVDKYGTEELETAIIACLTPETLARINWDSGYWWQNLPDLAFVLELHPDLR